MKNENLHNQIVKYVTSRGTWLRAGNNNIVNYLGRGIGCGANRFSDIREVLLAPSDLLHVDHDNGHIRRIGLRVWLGADVEIQEVPKDLASAWNTIEQLRSQLKTALAKNGDIDQAVELATEAEARALAAEADVIALQEQVRLLGEQLTQPVAGDSEEVARLKAQVAGLQSSIATRENTVKDANTRARAAEGELATLARYRKIIPMLETPEGRALISLMTHLKEDHGLDLSKLESLPKVHVLRAVV